MSLKLMKRDMETNGSGGGAMNPIEGAGAQKSQHHHIPNHHLDCMQVPLDILLPVL